MSIFDYIWILWQHLSHLYPKQQQSFLCIQYEVSGGTNININPPIIKSIAVNFQLAKSMWRIKTSTRALRGMPKIVPNEINRGNV